MKNYSQYSLCKHDLTGGRDLILAIYTERLLSMIHKVARASNLHNLVEGSIACTKGLPESLDK